MSRLRLRAAPRRRRLHVFGFLMGSVSLFCCLLLYWTGQSTLSPSNTYVADLLETLTGGAYLIDTPGCKIPDLEPRSAELLPLLYDYDGVQCGDPPPLVESNDTALFVAPGARAEYRELSCCYTAVWRHAPRIRIPEERHPGASSGPLHDGKLYDNDIRFADECVPFRDSVAIDGPEFVRVECREGRRLVYRDYHGFVPLKAPMTGNSSDVLWSERSLNVLVVGVDSVSRLNFLRTMPRTAALLAGPLRAPGMLGYNKVEDNTFPNLVPLLSGLSVEELQSTCNSPRLSMHFDACPWVWRRFNQHGYVNAFAEDTAWLSIFQYLKKGFINQPTEYDARPLLYLGEKHLSAYGRRRVCIGRRYQIDVLFGYAAKFVRKMHAHGRKFFGFFWGTSLSHNYLNQPDEADALYERFLLELMASGALNTTALVFMSDHGLRFGRVLSTFQGHLEERLPVLHVALPDWFRRRYPGAVRNLEGNARARLVTVFDLHETLLDLLDVRVLEAPLLERSAAALREAYHRGGGEDVPRGMSLFLPVPAERTCAEAGIPAHYCACQHLRRVGVGEPGVRKAAAFAVLRMNRDLGAEPRCRPLVLAEVREAWLGRPVSHVHAAVAGRARRFRVYEYRVTLSTRPGDGLFSATVWHNLKTGAMWLAGGVTRLNAYGDQGWCASEAGLRLYCHCEAEGITNHTQLHSTSRS